MLQFFEVHYDVCGTTTMEKKFEVQKSFSVNIITLDLKTSH